MVNVQSDVARECCRIDKRTMLGRKDCEKNRSRKNSDQFITTRNNGLEMWNGGENNRAVLLVFLFTITSLW